MLGQALKQSWAHTNCEPSDVVGVHWVRCMHSSPLPPPPHTHTQSPGSHRAWSGCWGLSCRMRVGGVLNCTRSWLSTAVQKMSGLLQDTLCSSGQSAAVSPVLRASQRMSPCRRAGGRKGGGGPQTVHKLFSMTVLQVGLIARDARTCTPGGGGCHCSV